MGVLRRAMEALRGWRTLLTSLMVASIGVLEAANWAQLVPDGPAKGWVLLGIALAMAWLRVITRGPVGGEPLPRGEAIHE